MRSLRARLILSHVLPLAATVPLIGLALLYLLETQVLIRNFSTELQKQAVLVAQITTHRMEIWHQPETAQSFVEQMGERLGAWVTLFSPRGELLASSNPAETAGSRQPLPQAVAHGGQSVLVVTHKASLSAEVVEVWLPVVDERGQVIGVVRMTDPLPTLQARFRQLRSMVFGVLLGGLLLGVALGWGLALTLERPLARATESVYHLASGEDLTPLPERGPREIRLLLRAVNTLAERLRLSQETRRRLLANLVHEVGRPLGAIRSAVQALSGGADRDEPLRRELLQGMEEHLNRLDRLLDDLVHLHDQPLGTLDLERQPTPLGDWLRQTVAPWQAAAKAAGLAFHLEAPADLPTLDVDGHRLAQALGNLLSNAIRYTPRGGAVRVSAGTADGRVWIQVQDTGPGIPPEEQERVFTPFYRGQSAGRFPQGMGLGLSIARDLVQAHGGELALESRPGQGSTFTIRLPLPQTAA